MVLKREIIMARLKELDEIGCAFPLAARVGLALLRAKPRWACSAVLDIFLNGPLGMDDPNKIGLSVVFLQNQLQAAPVHAAILLAAREMIFRDIGFRIYGPAVVRFFFGDGSVMAHLIGCQVVLIVNEFFEVFRDGQIDG